MNLTWFSFFPCAIDHFPLIRPYSAEPFITQNLSCHLELL